MTPKFGGAVMDDRNDAMKVMIELGVSLAGFNDPGAMVARGFDHIHVVVGRSRIAALWMS